MNILLTGGLGYIGSHIVIEAINYGYNVIIVDNLYNSHLKTHTNLTNFLNKKIPFYNTDICNEIELSKIFEKEKIDAVIHLAGYKAVGESVLYPLKYYENNVYSTINLLKVMAKYSVNKIIFSSSATVYKESDKMPLTEDMPLGTTNPYAESKLISEKIIIDAAKSNNNLHGVILRYFNPIGAHPCSLFGENIENTPNNLMPFITKVAAGQKEFLSVFGSDYPTKDGTGVRDYIHVCDLAKAHILAIKAFNFEENINIYNIGTGKGYSVLEIINAFIKSTGINIPYKMVERRNGDIALYYADCTKAYNELNFKTEKNLDEMCKDAWNYQKNNLKNL